MPIFISWSGARSKAIAEALHEWLPLVIQNVEPWMSKNSIGKGLRGEGEMAKSLEEAQVGIICLTPTNLHADWILFEAGALSKISDAHVCTYLWELKPSQVERPLGQFQHTLATREETLALLTTINEKLDESLDKQRLEKLFEKFWSDLNAKLKSINEIEEDGKTEARRSSDSMFGEIVDTLRRIEKKIAIPAAPFPLDRASVNNSEARLLQALLSSPSGLPLTVYKGKQFDEARKSIVTKGLVDKEGNKFVLNQSGLRVLGGILMDAWENL